MPFQFSGHFLFLYPPTDEVTQGSEDRKREDIKAEPWENVMFRGHEDEEGPAKDAEKKEEIIVSGKPSKESISRRKACSSLKCCCEDKKNKDRKWATGLDKVGNHW